MTRHKSVTSLSYLPSEWLLGVGHTRPAPVDLSEPHRPAEPVETELSPHQHHLDFCLWRKVVFKWFVLNIIIYDYEHYIAVYTVLHVYNRI